MIGVVVDGAGSSAQLLSASLDVVDAVRQSWGIEAEREAGGERGKDWFDINEQGSELKSRQKSKEQEISTLKKNSKPTEWRTKRFSILI